MSQQSVKVSQMPLLLDSSQPVLMFSTLVKMLHGRGDTEPAGKYLESFKPGGRIPNNKFKIQSI